MAISTTPWMAGVTCAAANTVYSLQTLIAALPDASKPSQLSNPSGQLKVAYVQIQQDSASGGAKGYIGNRANMTATDCGVQLVASQSWAPPSLGGNWYRLDQVFLMADTNTTKFMITFITR